MPLSQLPQYGAAAESMAPQPNAPSMAPQPNAPAWAPRRPESSQSHQHHQYLTTRTAFRVRRARSNAMNPRIQCALTP
jgi:hypothetical protein